MSRTSLGLLGALSAALLLVVPAHAQQGSESSEAVGPDSTDLEARSLFAAGATAYEAGRYADACAHFTRAYELSGRAELLYNIGQCEDRLRHDEAAIAAFEGFLELLPDDAHAAAVRARLTILREASAGATAREQSVEPPQPAEQDETAPIAVDAAPDASPSSSDSWAPWILVGLGAALALGGAVSIAAGALDLATVEGAADGTRYESVRDADQRAPILSGVGWGALAAGVVLAGAGVGWVLAGDAEGSGPSALLRVVPGGVALGGRF